MRLFKGFFVVLVGLFIFITILSLFIPSSILVTRAVVINAKAGKVFNEVSNLQNWKHWQPVFTADSANIRFQTGTNGISDSCYWNSKGKKNEMFITGKKDNMVTIILARKGEHDVLNTIRVLPLADSTQVQTEWSVFIKLKWYPWEKFYGIFIEKVSGQGYEDALNSLKNYVENN